MWECTKCGCCCELFAPIVFGHECPYFDKEKRICKNYENRPQICRTQLFQLLQKHGTEYDSINKEGYLKARCKLLQHLKKWKEETPGSEAFQEIIIRACAEAKLIPQKNL